jgi:transaldolase
MRLLLDTANLEEIRRAARMGVISGITTKQSAATNGEASAY